MSEGQQRAPSIMLSNPKDLTVNKILNQFGFLDKLSSLKEGFCAGVERMGTYETSPQYAANIIKSGQEVTDVVNTGKRTYDYTAGLKNEGEKEKTATNDIYVAVVDEYVAKILNEEKWTEKLAEDVKEMDKIMDLKIKTEDIIEKSRKKVDENKIKMAEHKKEIENAYARIATLEIEKKEQDAELSKLDGFEKVIMDGGKYITNLKTESEGIKSDKENAESQMTQIGNNAENKIKELQEEYKKGVIDNSAINQELKACAEELKNRQAILNTFNARKSEIQRLEEARGKLEGCLNTLNKAIKKYINYKKFKEEYDEYNDSINPKWKLAFPWRSIVAAIEKSQAAEAGGKFIFDGKREINDAIWAVKSLFDDELLYSKLIDHLTVPEKLFKYRYAREGLHINEIYDFAYRVLPNFCYFIDTDFGPTHGYSDYLKYYDIIRELLGFGNDICNGLIKDIDSCIEDYRKYMGTNVVEFKELINKINEALKTVVEGSRNQVEQLKIKLSSQVAVRDGLFLAIEERTKLLDALEAEITDARNKIEECTNELEKHSARLDEIKKEFDETNAELAALRERIIILNVEKDELKNELDYINTNIKTCEEAMKELKRLIAELKAELETAEGEEAIRIREKLKEKEAELAREELRLQNLLKQKHDIINALNEKMYEINEASAAYKELENRRQELINEVNEIDKRVNELEETIKENMYKMDKNMYDFEDELGLLLDNIAELEKLMDEIDKTIEEYKIALEKYKKKKNTVICLGVFGGLALIIGIVGLIIGANKLTKFYNEVYSPAHIKAATKPLIESDANTSYYEYELTKDEKKTRNKYICGTVISGIILAGSIAMGVVAGVIAAKYLTLSKDTEALIEEYNAKKAHVEKRAEDLKQKRDEYEYV